MSEFVMFKSVLREQYAALRERGWLVSYSVKTNPAVASVLERETDSLFSVHSLRELRHVSDASRVWFLAQAVTDDLVAAVIAAGISRFVVENEVDLDALLKALHARPKSRIEVMLRMKIRENTVFTGKYYVFGMDARVVEGRVLELARDEQVTSVGIHFHRKTQNVSEWELIGELSDSLSAHAWRALDVVNIGGGFPARYRNISDAVIESVFAKVCAVQQWLGQRGVALMVEPGRFLAAPCMELRVNVIAVVDKTLIVDASVYNAAMDTLLVPIKLLVEGEREEGERYLIKGCTPCSMDIFRYDVRFEKAPGVGDVIVFKNAGAYTFATDFCELAPVPLRVVD